MQLYFDSYKSSCIYIYIYIYIYIHIYIFIFMILCSVFWTIHIFWTLVRFGVPLVTLSVNFLEKYMFLNEKAIFKAIFILNEKTVFAFETKLICYFNWLFFASFSFISSKNWDVLELWWSLASFNSAQCWKRSFIDSICGEYFSIWA